VIGRVLGSYRIISQIGEGGMGAVYLAEHPIIHKQAAVKVLRPEISRNEEMLDRFFDEARATARLQHPAFVEVFDCGVADGSAFIVMEYVRGESLGARLARLGRLPVAETLAVGGKIAQAVGMAHAHGIVHRDLKPDNIIVCADGAGDELKILDFGIAKLSSVPWDHHRRTRTGVVMGTPQYMSPEQCRGAASVDQRADVYSLGCILYALLVGHPPFAQMSDADVVAAQLYEAARPLQTHDPEIPLELDRLVARTLAKSPDDRPRTMDEVAAALATLGAGQPVAVPPAPETVRSRPAAAPSTLAPTSGEMAATTARVRRSRAAVWAVVGGAALVTVAVSAALMVASGRSEPPVRVDVGVEPHATPAPVPAPALVAPPQVRVRITSDPAGAVVRDGAGQTLGTTPFEHSFPRAAGTLQLMVDKKGYRPRAVAVPLDADSERAVPLQRRRAGPAVDPDEWRKL
jgi:serine/threonine-protein kinase